LSRAWGERTNPELDTSKKGESKNGRRRAKTKKPGVIELKKKNREAKEKKPGKA